MCGSPFLLRVSQGLGLGASQEGINDFRSGILCGICLWVGRKGCRCGIPTPSKAKPASSLELPRCPAAPGAVRARDVTAAADLNHD